ncbi:MAG: aldehyde dehydrogenase (NAD+) [Marivirga sp.]
MEKQLEIFNKQKAFFASQQSKAYSFRKAQLKKLKKIIQDNEEAIIKALRQDFGKHPFESYVSEIGVVYEEINIALKYLSQWMRPRRVGTSLLHFPSSSKVYYQPKGVCLIIGPWNYPFNLLMSPLVASLAAGNTCMLKPPEETTRVSGLVQELIGKHFEEEYVAVVTGEGKVVVPQLMENLHFDHVFFTGSVAVGKIIAKMAAEKLVTTTLELGGKSPCVVDKSASLEVAAYRIAFSKMVNAGQTCVAPDYLLIHESIEEEFLDELKAALMTFYGSLAPTESKYLAQIINQKRYDTLKGYLQEGKRIFGGTFDDKTRKIAPAMITNITEDDRLFHEEIFGPIFAVFIYKTDEEALEIISKNPNPLALYIYSNSKKVTDKFIQTVPFGGGCINNGLVHLGNPELPFGGVGNSGQGNYHGKAGFMTFSHEKSIMKTGTWFDLKLKYPPYSSVLMKIVKRFMR